MTASPLTHREIRTPARHLVLLCVLIVPWTVVVMPLDLPRVAADLPGPLDRGGRICGGAWGDGYHACRSSGSRPFADLPPRTYAARAEAAQERIAGCANCGPRRLPSVDPIRSPGGPQTFYHRFDQYAAHVSHQEAQAEARRPQQPIIDPEANVSRGHARESYPANPLAQNRFLHSPPASDTGNASTPPTADGKPAAPAMSVEELDEFRQYQAEKRARNRFEKYLIQPDQIEPSQSFGGPPVGSEQRRRIDEAKIKARQDEPTQHSKQDGTRSDDDHLPSPGDDLLPPFPREEELRQDSLRRENRVKQPEDEHPDDSDSAHRQPLGTSELDFNAPRQNNPSARPVQVQRAFAPVSQPQARVAEKPTRRFVKQPR